MGKLKVFLIVITLVLVITFVVAQEFIIEGAKGTFFFINNETGNVGIGTSSPGEKLEVTGNINSTGGDVCITGGNCLSSFNDSDYISYNKTWDGRSVTLEALI